MFYINRFRGHALSSLIIHRQVQRENATRARRALHTYSTAVRFDDLLHQTKPDSAALYLRRDRFMSAVKRLEDVSNINEANPQTTIFNGNPYFVSLLGGPQFSADTCPTTLTVVLDCVTDEILDSPFQRGSVASNWWQIRVDYRLDMEILVLHLRLAGSNRIIN